MTARHVDWAKVEEIYRTGLVSVSEIAREAGLTEGAIRKRAKQGKWKRDLTAKVRAKTGEKLVLALANASESTNQLPRTDEETVELAAQTQVAVVRTHQNAIRRGQEITARLLQELDTTTSRAGEMEEAFAGEDDAKKKYAMMRAVSLPARAGVMRDLAQAARVWTGLERQAFGISEDRKNPNDNGDAAVTASELLAELQADAEALGMKLLPPPSDYEPAPSGVANRPRKNGADSD
jgi:hypothetical protein